MERKVKDKTITLNYNHWLKKETIGEFLLKKGHKKEYVSRLIYKKMIRINGKEVTNENEKLSFFPSKISVRLLFETNDLPPKKGNINILYEDPYLLIVNKPANMDVEPTRRNYYDTLGNLITNYYIAKGIHSKLHLVNRLDKVTSGIVIVAKNGYIHHMMTDVEIKKKYRTTVKGKIDKPGVIKVGIRKSDDGILRVVDESGKNAITEYTPVKYDPVNDTTVVDINLVTGRTHQIRISFDHIGHPLIGDKLYGNVEGNYSLVAYKVDFKHPVTKKKISINLDNIDNDNKKGEQ